MPFPYSTNGGGIVEDDCDTGLEKRPIDELPDARRAPVEIPGMGGIVDDSVADELPLPFNRSLRNPDGSVKEPRHYQRTAIDRSVEAISPRRKRLLLTLATGTGKTFVSMQNLERIKAGRLQEAIDVILPIFEKACRYIPGHFQPTETLGVRPRSSS